MPTGESSEKNPIVFDENWGLVNMLDLRSEIDSLYRSTLRPYDDSFFLNDRLQSESRVIRKNPEIVSFVDEVLLADDEESLVVVSDLLSDALLQAQPIDKPAPSIVLSYLTLVSAVAKRKNTLQSSLAHPGRQNAIGLLIARNVIAQIPDERVNEFLITAEYLIHALDHAKNSAFSSEVDHEFLKIKLSIFKDGLYERATVSAYAEALPSEDAEVIDLEMINQDSEFIASIFNEMRSKQKYGVKLGYRQHRAGGSLIFSEIMMPSVIGEAHPITYRTPAVAEVVHSKYRTFKNLKPQEILLDKGAIAFNYDHLGIIAHYYIGPSGELYADRNCDYAMRDIFVKKGKYSTYRALQAEVLASFFDLTRSASVVERVQQTLTDRSVVAVYSNKKEPLDDFRKLVIPRLQVEKILLEDTDEKTEVQASNRSVKYHGVTWHRRRLPEGWQPSPEAINLAHAVGIVLNENETFVRAHYRGVKELGEVVGHQLFDRQN